MQYWWHAFSINWKLKDLEILIFANFGTSEDTEREKSVSVDI